jgi:hypothetical protein
LPFVLRRHPERSEGPLYLFLLLPLSLRFLLFLPFVLLAVIPEGDLLLLLFLSLSLSLSLLLHLHLHLLSS